MSEDSKFELAIVETVYSFYRKLLHDSLQEPVPLPPDLHLISLGELDRHFPDPLARIRGWLKLLDMAVTPSMLRQSLTAEVDPEIAETLLRYYARKKAAGDVDRDKADFVATFLYRNPRVPGQWERHGYTLDGVVPIPPFEIALIEIVADAPEMPEEYVPILREFDFLREELETYSTLEALTDAGIVQKGRDLKQAFGTYFYHPGVLAAIGPYNAAIGKKLEDLFRATTQQLKSFAEEVHKEGGDVTSPLEGKVTIQHLSMIEEGEILKADYTAGQEKFRRVSKVKKAVDQRKSGNAVHANKRHEEPTEEAAQTAPPKKEKHHAAVSPSEDVEEHRQPQRSGPIPPRFLGQPAPQMPRFDVPPSAAASAEAPRGLPARGFVGAHGAAAEPAKIYDAQLEEGKLRSVDDSIRVFVKAAEAKSRQVVPMRSFNLTLSPVEADACGAEYWDEKSFRGEYARAMSRVVALVARMSTELEELRQKQNSAHLWKPHASSMRFLLDASNAAFDQSTSVLAVAGQRGLNEKINAMKESLQKLRTRMDSAEQLMKELEIRNQQ